MTLNQDQRFSIDNLCLIKELYNNKDSKYAHVFDLERMIVNQIVDFISSRIDFTKDDFRQIQELYNSICNQPHHNGAPWLDFKIRLSHFVSQFSYAADWDSVTGELTISR